MTFKDVCWKLPKIKVKNEEMSGKNKALMIIWCFYKIYSPSKGLRWSGDKQIESKIVAYDKFLESLSMGGN